MKESKKKAARAAAHYSKEARAFLDGLTLKTERDSYVAAYGRVVEASKLADRTAGLSASSETVVEIGYKLAHDAGVRAVEERRRKSERDAKAKRDARAAAAKKPGNTPIELSSDVGQTGQLVPLTPAEDQAIVDCMGPGPSGA